MTAKMTRLPSFNDLRIGALAKNGIKDTKERGTSYFIPSWTRVTTETGRKEASCYFEEERRFTKNGPKTRGYTFGLISFLPFYFVSP